MTSKRPSVREMSVSEYQAFARRLERRFSADKPADQLPLAPKRGRPAKGQQPLGLESRTVKLPAAVWKELRAAAKRHGVTVNGVLIALGQELVGRAELDATIDRLIAERLLEPSGSR